MKTTFCGPFFKSYLGEIDFTFYTRNKALLREYMNQFKKAGYYGKARIATYSGTNAMYELATSPDQKDKEMYLEYCEFIVNNPLRK